ncbi:MAG: hypothetical protein E6J34_13475 [Chloroflexi bacterium]|nr:MAG: hypothetical protein E6J34_13475 [Chloroflexota bacterium]
MDITVAYFHPLFHPDAVRRDFEQIRALGASSIIYAIHEQEEQRWSRDLDRALRMAQEVGLKVIFSLGRYGNLFAGPSFMPSWYTFRHPDSRVKDRHGRYHGISCYNHEAFRSWLYKEVEYFISNYPLHGILIDEPRNPDITCFCSVCRALCPDITDLDHFRRRSLLEFLGELFASVKRVNALATTAVVLLPQDLDLAEELAAHPALDSLGCHLFWQLLHEDIARVEEWGHTLVAAAKTSHKRSQLWMQNFNLDEEHELLLETAFTKMLNADPDEIACYYYWRNNVDPEHVWQTTRGLLRRIPRRQLFWQPSPRVAISEAPVQNSPGFIS